MNFVSMGLRFRGGQDAGGILASRFFRPISEVGVRVSYDYGGGNKKYQLLKSLGDGSYWQIDLDYHTEAVSGAPENYLGMAAVVVPYQTVAAADAVRGGTGWQGPFAQAACYGGQYFYNGGAVGGYFEYVTPDATTRVGSRTYHNANGGIAVVSIDGDKTAAVLLPTAQDLVTAGTLAAAALVANGGTLAPTDRVLDFSNGTSSDTKTMFAVNLAPGIHTVRLSGTGYKAAAAANTRMYVTGLLYGGAYTNLSTPGITITPAGNVAGGFWTIESLLSSNSAYEYALTVTPAGASTANWVGNVHGYDRQQSLTITVDGVVQNIPLYGIVAGASVGVTRVTKFYHPQINSGNTSIADASTSYTLDAVGLAVNSAITWAANAVMGAGYVAMYPIDNAYNQGRNHALKALPVALNKNDGSQNVLAVSNLAYVWKPGGKYAAALFLPPADLALSQRYRREIAPGTSVWIEDRADGAINKIYVERSGFELCNVTVGDVWNMNARYLLVKIEPTADEKLAGSCR